MSYYCPTLKEEAPRWVYLFNCICLFFYQTMDALDGKQARRTGTSSPLGELFDHGCDALTTIFVALTVASTVRLGNGILLYLAVLSLLIPFYTTQWEEYFTGTLVLGYIGVTEGQILSMSLYLAAFIRGPDVFSTTIPLFGLTLSLTTWIALFCIISGIGQTFWNVSIVIKLASEKKLKLSTAIKFITPLILIIAISCFWHVMRPECIVETPHTFHLMLGLAIANFVGRIIVYRVCSLDASLFLELLVPLIICSTISIFTSSAYISTKSLVYICLLIYFLLYMNFALSIINQMTKHLNIRCLVIPTPNKATKLEEKKKN